MLVKLMDRMLARKLEAARQIAVIVIQTERVTVLGYCYLSI